MALRPQITRLMIAAALGLAGTAGPMAVRAQNADQTVGDQYRCDTSGTRCAYYRCDPSGEGCRRTGDWAMRDYSHGVDGDAPSYDRPGTYDQRRGDQNADNDRRDGDDADDRTASDYARNDQSRYQQGDGYQSPPADQGRSDRDRATPAYHASAQYRCTDDGDRCAYFRCDTDGDNCHRVSGWSSRADADRRPDYNGW